MNRDVNIDAPLSVLLDITKWLNENLPYTLWFLDKLPLMFTDQLPEEQYFELKVGWVGPNADEDYMLWRMRWQGPLVLDGSDDAFDHNPMMDEETGEPFNLEFWMDAEKHRVVNR